MGKDAHQHARLHKHDIHMCSYLCMNVLCTGVCVCMCLGHFPTCIFKYSIIKASWHHSTASPMHTHSFMLDVCGFKPPLKLGAQRMGVKAGACRAERTQGSPHHLLPRGQARLDPLHSSSSLERLEELSPPRTLRKCSDCSRWERTRYPCELTDTSHK